MLFVCYPKCSTCQKAKKYLDDRGAEYELRDIKADNPSADELKKWIKLSGLPVKRFFNTSGMQYRALGLKDKIDKMSEDEQISMLASDGMLVKRPLLIAGETVLAGFRESEYEKALG